MRAPEEPSLVCGSTWRSPDTLHILFDFLLEDSRLIEGSRSHRWIVPEIRKEHVQQVKKVELGAGTGIAPRGNLHVQWA